MFERLITGGKDDKVILDMLFLSGAYVSNPVLAKLAIVLVVVFIEACRMRREKAAWIPMKHFNLVQQFSPVTFSSG